MKTYITPTGERIDEAVRKMFALVWESDDDVETDFNGIVLTVNIGDSTKIVMDRFHEQIKRREQARKARDKRKMEEEVEAIKAPYRKAIRQANYLMGQDGVFFSKTLYEKWLALPIVEESLKEEN
jgi:hypothetical protein